MDRISTITTQLAALALALWASTSTAGIIRYQDNTLAALGATQDGYNITRDSANGLEWLDWTLTTGQTTAGMQWSLLGSHYLLQDWRMATATEFADLGEAAGVPQAFVDQKVAGGPAPELVALAESLGFTRAVDQSAFAAFGETGTGGAGTLRLGGLSLAARDSHGRTLPFSIFDLPNAPQLWLSQSWPESVVHATVGVALVRRMISIPAPFTAALFAIGLLVLVAAGRLPSQSVKGPVSTRRRW